MFRHCIFTEIGEFDENLHSLEDIDYWLRIAATQRWEFYREPRALCYYRVRPSGLSFNVEQMRYYNSKVIQAASKRSPELIPMLATAYAYMYRYLSRLSLQGGDSEKARYFVDLALACDKSIFFHDIRSLLTLIAVYLAPLANMAIGFTLSSAKSK
jgi:hypothetical protein